MKKNIILFLTIIMLALSISTGCCEADADPIVGAWYMNMELGEDFVFPNDEGYTRAIQILIFLSDGAIIKHEIDLIGKETEIIGPAIVGKWVKTGDNEYNMSILVLGTNKAYISNNMLYAIAVTEDLYFGYHKMATLDWYEEILMKTK